MKTENLSAEKYWQGQFRACELFQMPNQQRAELKASLLKRCEDIVATNHAWIDVRNVLKHNKAGREAREKCWQLWTMKPKNGGNTAA